MFKMKTVLIISPEPWRWQYVSKHHYAITLSKQGYGIYFLNPPSVTYNEVTILPTEYTNLYEIEAPKVAKGLRFYPKKLRNYLERRWLEKLEKTIGQTFTTVWLFENSRFYDMAFAGDRLKIYHQVDSNQNFHIKEAASSADICFCITDFIKRDLLVYNKNVFQIDHGIRFSDHHTALSKEQQEYFTLKQGIQAAYVGNLDSLDIDRDTLVALVKAFPDVTFQFIGSYAKEGVLYQRCEAFKNIVWWGRVESALIPAILEKVDLSIVCYIVNKNNANSHKMLEYLHSGKVTVSTYMDAYKDKRHLLEMTELDKTDQYNQLFKKVVDNLDFYNSAEKQQQRIAFAKEHSYESQLNIIRKYINTNTAKEI